MNIASVGAQAYQRLSTGLQINSAADNAAGLAITQGMDSEVRAMDQNVDNIGSMSDLTKTAEGALSGINDNLQRIRELALQAGNGTLTSSDRSLIQGEVDQLLEGIQSAARNTEFNTMRLLDGSFQNRATAMNTDGSGSQISIESAALSNLGIEGFDVTGSFDIADIDSAIAQVNESRSNLGSVQNAFEYASNNIQNSAVNLTSARSQIEDADIAQEISNLRREEILQQYRMFAQQAEQEKERTELGAIQGFNMGV